ncbi:ADP-ribosylation factor family-domain-containing protein [Chaetomidium leptoderma]|uniref:Small COPII coat GTPase SAR1 n=1 Tax=Chaetomidium leptoderma TaxID=669021 RepID=A0AAN6VEU4_9PEZI|nr:ADP-ribosylation factor family-domain-containing protein [Chaetomidium leptoderma]
MGFLDWFYYPLAFFGLLRLQRAKVLFLGLDNAGKSTLLQMVSRGRRGIVAPTLHPTLEEWTIGRVVFATLDLAGHQEARRLWRDYLHDTTAVVFIVDAKDPGRFDEAAAALHELSAMEQLARVPFAVLGNKIDHPDAVSEDFLRDRLGLWQITIRPIELFMCSIAAKTGYGEGLRWLAAQL